MGNAKRDDNMVTTALAVDTDGVVEPLRVDASTYRLLIDITSVAYNTAAPTMPATSPRDSNMVVIGMGVTDDANLTPTPILMDATSGDVWVDVVME